MRALATATEFIAFLAAIFAVVVAIQLYSLLRTGEIGKTWRVLILSAVVFGLKKVISLGETFDLIPDTAGDVILDAVFVTLLAIAFYMQRRAFFTPHMYRLLESRSRQTFPARYERLQTDGDFDDFEIAPADDHIE